MPALTFYGTGFYSEIEEGGGIGGRGVKGERVGSYPPTPPHFLTSFLLLHFHLSHRLQVWEGKQRSMLLSHCFVDTFEVPPEEQ